MWQLILFRGIQGLGAGAIFPIALAVIGDLFSPRERGKYQGLFGGVFALSSIIGPALGGFLTDTISWHWVFLVNLPLGIVALVVLWRLLPPVRHPEAVRSIDYLGAAVFTAALVPLLIGLTNKQFGEWTDPQVGGLIAVGLLLSAVFVWVESRAAEPILPLELFRNRTVTGSIIATFLITFGFFGAIIFLPRWFQFVLGSSATESGYQMLPLMVGVIGSSIGSGLIVARTGRYKWMTVGAMAISVIGLFLHDRHSRRHPRHPGLALDVHRRPRHRAVIRDLHDRRAERGRTAHARRRHQLAHLLPPGRRIGRPGDRRHDLRQLVRRPRSRDSSASHGVPQPIIDGFSAAGAVEPGRPDQRRGRPRPADPGVGAGGRRGPRSSRSSGRSWTAIHQAFSVSIASTMWVAVFAAMAAAAVVAAAGSRSSSCADRTSPESEAGAGTARPDRGVATDGQMPLSADDAAPGLVDPRLADPAGAHEPLDDVDRVRPATSGS